MAAIRRTPQGRRRASLAYPGGNITGFSAFVTELSGKRVELIKEAVPGVTRLGFLNNMSNPISHAHAEGTECRHHRPALRRRSRAKLAAANCQIHLAVRSRLRRRYRRPPA